MLKLKQKICVLVLSSVAVLPAFAEDMTSAAMELCEKVKSCAMEQIATEDLTPELREMMQPMLDNMCANMQSKVEEVSAGDPLYAPALACMRSMQSLTCQMMQDPKLVQTPECQAYEKLAGQADAPS
jgi:hypothetical protein